MIAYGPILNPTAGLAIRTRGVLQDLASLMVPVEIEAFTVLSVGERQNGSVDINGKHVAVIGLPQGLYGTSYQLLRRAAEMVAATDLIIVESAAFLPSVLLLRWIRRGDRALIVWDTNDCESYHYSQLPLSLRNRIYGRVWAVLEQIGTRKVDSVVALSETHARIWQRLFPIGSQRIAVVDFHPLHEPDSSVRRLGWTERPMTSLGTLPTLVFVGTMIAKHNRAAAGWLTGHLAPRLSVPARLLLIGQGTEAIPTRQIGRVSIEGLGQVPDLLPFLRGASVCLAPLLSSAGPKTKVLDYVAAGCRVVGTPIAYEGLEGCPGFVIADLDDFAASVERVLNMPDSKEEAASRSSQQSEWLRSRHSSSNALEQWQVVLSNLGFVAPDSLDS